MPHPDYVMPSSEKLADAAATIHEARMALYEDEAVKARFPHVVGNEHATMHALIHCGLNAGHEALNNLRWAVAENERKPAADRATVR